MAKAISAQGRWRDGGFILLDSGTALYVLRRYSKGGGSPSMEAQLGRKQVLLYFPYFPDGSTRRRKLAGALLISIVAILWHPFYLSLPFYPVSLLFSGLFNVLEYVLIVRRVNPYQRVS